MPGRDIIVIGASAGGYEALTELCRALPSNLPAALFIVWHMPSSGIGMLPTLLNRNGALPAGEAVDGESIKHGHIYVAQVDRHLLVEKGHIRVTKGPKENRFRPAIDPLFRSAAAAYGPRVIGIVLSGALNDGTSGLWSIKDRGGIAIVQDPAEAIANGMPLSALQNVDVDYQLPVAQMPALLAQLASEPVDTHVVSTLPERLRLEVKIAQEDKSTGQEVYTLGKVSEFTCPECHGTLWRLPEGKTLRFRCRTGHAYTSDALLADLADSIEAMQWASVRGIQESGALMEHIADHFRQVGDIESANRFLEQAKRAYARGELVRRTISQDEPVPFQLPSNASAPI